MKKLVFVLAAFLLAGCWYTGPTPQENRENGYVDINTCEKYGWCLKAKVQSTTYPVTLFLNETNERKQRVSKINTTKADPVETVKDNPVERVKANPVETVSNPNEGDRRNRDRRGGRKEKCERR